MAEISAGLLWEIFTHARSWLANLNRAGEQRKRQSIQALRGIITASRQTAVYLRQLGITRLAKRCQITGKHWSDPSHYDREFLEKADVSLERMERLATEILHQIKR
jgi:hypothetical protein